ncbi:flagellar assembly protein FliH [Undibacterium sp. TJN19]|uniref:flagellar assembly protein FliH n=1 Tax=Undibacterium sp. TJN19 TaxID=3413055 RepID=UPI003BEFFFA2
MSNPTRAGDLTAFQRWEMTSFGDNRPAHVEEVKQVTANTAAINRAEAEKIRESARQEGFAAGYKEAYERGLKDGQETGYNETVERVQSEIQALQQLAKGFSEQIGAASSQMGSELMELAIDLAQAMLKAKLDADPEIILPIVEDAISQLSAIQQPAQIFLNPEDAVIIKNQLGETLIEGGWRVIADPHMERGGCRLETLHNMVDASYATRWQKLMAGIQHGLHRPG